MHEAALSYVYRNLRDSQCTVNQARCLALRRTHTRDRTARNERFFPKRFEGITVGR